MFTIIIAMVMTYRLLDNYKPTTELITRKTLEGLGQYRGVGKIPVKLVWGRHPEDQRGDLRVSDRGWHRLLDNHGGLQLDVNQLFFRPTL
jgi:hypothetical protein